MPTRRIADVAAMTARGFASTAPMHVAVLIVAVAVCATFSPSLYHIARSDQWCFLAECAPYDSWGAMVQDLHSYDRVRTIQRGCTLLFRPLLITLLCTEEWVFDWNFFWWQAVGLVLHLAVAYAMLRLLWEMHRGVCAVLATLFFATLFIGHMAVTWHHCNGYVLYVLFQLWALYHVFRHAEEGQVYAWRLWAIAALVMAGGLTHEAANAQGPVLAAYLWYMRGRNRHGCAQLPRHWLALLLAPVVVYVAWDVADYRWLHPPVMEAVMDDAKLVGGNINVTKTAWCMLAIPSVFAMAALFPTLQKMGHGATLVERPVNWDFEGSFSFHHSPLALMTAVATLACLVAACLVVAWRYRAAAQQKERKRAGAGSWAFVVVVLALLMAETLLVSVGRAVPHNLVEYVLKDSSYYAYLTMAKAVVIAYACACSLGFDTLGRAAGRRVRLVCAGLLAFVALLNAARTFAENRRVGSQYPARGPLVFARINPMNVTDHYACAHDSSFGILMQGVCYHYLKYGVHCAVGLGHREKGGANLERARAIMPLPTNIVAAMELSERGGPEQAVSLLRDTFANTWLEYWEYTASCFRSLDKCNAAIAREPGNPARYQNRAVLYFFMNDFANAYADIERVQQLGGNVYEPLLRSLAQATNAIAMAAVPTNAPRANPPGTPLPPSF